MACYEKQFTNNVNKKKSYAIKTAAILLKSGPALFFQEYPGTNFYSSMSHDGRLIGFRANNFKDSNINRYYHFCKSCLVSLSFFFFPILFLSLLFNVPHDPNWPTVIEPVAQKDKAIAYEKTVWATPV